ncbi:MAG: membrane protein insertase YidC [Clostridia bacterium]|nr:membrane protein insertase YidC [Clostridia bacterium]
MIDIFGFLATPLGWVLKWIYSWTHTYFIAILLFTLAIRLLMFPLNIKQQKSAADRARLAPRLERIQKKYANDRQKLAEKQQALYEKEGVSLTGGCLPMIVQMLVLFSVIAVIYKPLAYVQQVPSEDISICCTAVVDAMKEDGSWDKDAKRNEQNFSENSYYREMNLMSKADQYEEQILAALKENGKKSEEEAQKIVNTLTETKSQFTVFGLPLLEQASKDGIKPNPLWIVAILSGVTSLFTSLLSMHYNKLTQPQQQQMGGCSPNLMMYMMPVMSLVISFSVPAGVAVYWIFSNLLAMVQTVVLNAMYNPAKIRAQAEAEYAERRRKKQEDKERLKAARLAEQAAWQKEENEKRAAKAGKKPIKKAEETVEATEASDTEASQETPADE